MPADPCPCCGAPRLTFDSSIERTTGTSPAMLAPRFDCKCWKRPTCALCALCLGHCLCAERGTEKLRQRKALGLVTPKPANVALPGIEVTEKRPTKGRKR